MTRMVPYGLAWLTGETVSGMVLSGPRNPSEKTANVLKLGHFYFCVHAPEKHGAFTAIHGREWANTTPEKGNMPAVLRRFLAPGLFCVLQSATIENF
ncbi:hypothetical protein [Mailhella massiliensis]|uniref:hypothetical protein n=1 Tax=Mailhella massiliensis TaxID=1903261 RepID=UPI001186E336|nr:hypothetical protein [Mailhella massiliensis]